MALAATLVWRRTFASYAVGLCSVLVAYAASNYIEGGSIFGYHASANLSALSDRWLGVRFERLVLWLIPPSPIFATGVGGLVVAWVDRLAGHSPARAQVIGLVAAAAIAVGAAADSYPLDSLWRAWPLGAIVLVPLSNYKGLAPFVWLSGATSLCVWLTSTHDGGAQWGPRVLLISTPAFLVLAAAAVHDTSAPGVYRHLRVAVVLVLVATGVWTTRAAYVDLRGWKRYYGTLVRSVEENTEVGSYVLTNVWWLDQICAPLYGTRTFLVAPSPPESSKALQQLQHGGVRSLYLAWSSENAETGLVPLAGSCYVIDRSLSFKERGVHLSHATCVE